MAIGITKLTNQTIESSESVATSSIEWASDTGGTVLNAGSGEMFQWVDIQISVTFNASATGDAILHLRTSSDDGTTESTEDVDTYAKTIACSAGNTVIVNHKVYDFDYLDVGMENKDSSYTLTWSAIYCGQKLTGMA